MKIIEVNYLGEFFRVDMVTGTIRRNGKILIGEMSLKQKIRKIAVNEERKGRD